MEFKRTGKRSWSIRIGIDDVLKKDLEGAADEAAAVEAAEGQEEEDDRGSERAPAR